VWVVVPKGSETPGSLVAGFAAVAKGATAYDGVGQARGGAQATGGLAGLYAAAEPQPVLLVLPRFKLEYTVPDLKADLSAMGMPRAFSPDDAELMGIVAPGTGGNVFIQQVVHKAVLDVNEAGVEAAAATGAIVGVTSVPVGRVTVRADRPFLVLITDESTHAPLFMAVVRTPRS
jgi:serine protease inhibitor